MRESSNFFFFFFILFSIHTREGPTPEPIARLFFFSVARVRLQSQAINASFFHFFVSLI